MVPSTDCQQWTDFLAPFAFAGTLECRLKGYYRPPLSSYIRSEMPLSICTLLEVNDARHVPRDKMAKWFMNANSVNNKPVELTIMKTSPEVCNLVHLLVSNRKLMRRNSPSWNVHICLPNAYDFVSDPATQASLDTQFALGDGYRRYVTYDNTDPYETGTLERVVMYIGQYGNSASIFGGVAARRWR